MAFVSVESTDPKEPPYECGGSIISRRFILTAGHCLCSEEEDVVPCNEKGRLLYNFRTQLKVYIGVNSVSLNESVDLAKRDPVAKELYERRPSRVYLHPTWKGYDDLEAVDLALIKLKTNLLWDGNRVMPICLPPSSRESSENLDVYAGGWGYTLRNQMSQDCVTNNDGPAKLSRCQTPFKYTRWHSRKSRIHKTCLAGSPSADHPTCKLFYRKNPDYSFANGRAVLIVQNKKDHVFCYSPTSDHGWCPVCKPNAKKRTPGFCPQRKYSRLHPNSYTKVVPGQGFRWGFCDNECSEALFDRKRFEGTQKLQEVQLTTLPRKHCKIFSSYEFQKHSICAGQKHKFPRFDVYQLKRKRRRRFYFVLRKKSAMHRVSCVWLNNPPPGNDRFLFLCQDVCSFEKTAESELLRWQIGFLHRRFWRSFVPACK